MVLFGSVWYVYGMVWNGRHGMIWEAGMVGMVLIWEAGGGREKERMFWESKNPTQDVGNYANGVPHIKVLTVSWDPRGTTTSARRRSWRGGASLGKWEGHETM